MVSARTDAVSLGMVALAALAGVALWPHTVSCPPRSPSTSLRRARQTAMSRERWVATVATMGFLGGLHLFVLGWNLGYPVPFDLVFVGSLLWAAAVCGCATGREGLPLG